MATGLHIDISTGNAFWSPNAFKQDLRADMGGGGFQSYTQSIPTDTNMWE